MIQRTQFIQRQPIYVLKHFVSQIFNVKVASATSFSATFQKIDFRSVTKALKGLNWILQQGFWYLKSTLVIDAMMSIANVIINARAASVRKIYVKKLLPHIIATAVLTSAIQLNTISMCQH